MSDHTSLVVFAQAANRRIQLIFDCVVTIFLTLWLGKKRLLLKSSTSHHTTGRRLPGKSKKRVGKKTYVNKIFHQPSLISALSNFTSHVISDFAMALRMPLRSVTKHSKKILVRKYIC